MEKLDNEEKRKIADMIKMKRDSGAGVNMDWMYSSKKDDTEEYLLGKKIDRQFEEGNETPPKEDDLFGERIRANIALDMQAKMREDPLYSIKKREEESKKKILHNPVRMKELQHMIAQQKKRKTKKSKNKHKGDKVDCDDDLVKRYLSILTQKHGEKADTSRRAESPSSDDQSDDQSWSSRRKLKASKSRSPHLCKSEIKEYGANKQYGLIGSKQHKKKAKARPRSRSRSRSRSRCRFQAESSQHSGSYKKSHKESDHSRPAAKFSSRHRTHSSHQKRKVSAEERERRLQEMKDNASWREEQRCSNVQRYAAEDKQAEKLDWERRMKKGAHKDSADFLNPLMSEHAKNSTVEDRLKRNKYNIQRTNAALEKDFTKH